jgi:hypothetical protein
LQRRYRWATRETTESEPGSCCHHERQGYAHPVPQRLPNRDQGKSGGNSALKQTMFGITNPPREG